MKINGGFQSYQGARSTAEKGQARISWGSNEGPSNRVPVKISYKPDWQEANHKKLSAELGKHKAGEKGKHKVNY